VVLEEFKMLIPIMAYFFVGIFLNRFWTYEFGPRSFQADIVETLFWPYGLFKYIRYSL